MMTASTPEKDYLSAYQYYKQTIHKHVSGRKLSGPEWHLADYAWQRCFAAAGAWEAAAIAPPGSELTTIGRAELERAEAAIREARDLAPLHVTASDATPPEVLAQVAAARLPTIKRTSTRTEGDQKGEALQQAGQLLDDARTNQAKLQAEFADLVAVGMGFEEPTVSVTDIVESTNGGLPLLPSRRNRGSGSLSPRAIQKALKTGLSDAEHAAFASTNRVPVKALERVRWQRWQKG